MEDSNSTEAIRRRIISEAEKKAQEIEADAKDKSTQILTGVKERAKEMKEAELEKIKKHVEEAQRQGIAEKKVDYHRRVQAFKSELIDDILNKVKEKLQKFVEKPAYQQILTDLIMEAGIALGGGEIIAKVNDRDKDKLSKGTLEKTSKRIEESTNTKTKIALERDTIKATGGAVASTADRKATVDNTFEARLDRMKEEARAELETILFK